MRVASISTEIKCHEWPEGNLQNSYTTSHASGKPFKSISWAKDGGWLVVVPATGLAEIISLNETAKLLHTVQEIAYPTCACFQNSTKRNIAIGTESGQLLVYDIKMKAVKKKFPQAPAAFFRVQYAPKDNHVIAGCQNGEVYVYNGLSVSVSACLKVPKSKTLTNFRCHGNKKNLVGGCSEEGVVTLWDINKSRSVVYMASHRAPVTDMSFSSISAELIGSVGMDRRMCFFDGASKKLVWDLNFTQTPTAMDICPNGTGVAVGFQDGKLATFDMRNMKEYVHKFSPHNSKISQLMFDKVTGEKVSIISLQEEANEQRTVGETNSKTINESAKYFRVDDLLPIPESDNERSSHESVQDSFLNAIGISYSIMTSSKTTSAVDGVEKLTDLNPNAQGDICHVSSSPIDDFSQPNLKPRRSHIDNFAAKNLISTPTSVSVQDLHVSHMSPILAQSSNTLAPSEADMKRVFKEAMKETLEEFKEELKEFKKEMRYQMLDVMGMTRRHFLDLQMSIVKEFIKVEDNMNRFRDDVLSVDDVLSTNESLKYILESATKEK